MGIISIDGFEFFEGSYKDNNPYKNPIFNLVEPEIERKIDYIKEKSIKRVSIGTNYHNLDFLSQLDFIEYVSIENNINIEKLYFLKDLKELHINSDNKKINLDYSKFPKLEILSIDWHNNFPGLYKNCNLKELYIWKFKPKSKSLAELSLPNSLEKLHITESNILSLEGLELCNLKEFEGHYCNGLETVKGIDKFAKNLNVLILDYCRKLSSYEYLKYTENLEKLILGDCGDIPNLNWLKELKNVKHFSFWNTKLTDGDTTPCFGIDYISFKNQKYYNHKVEEFRENTK
jgi:hypothetical protein